MKYDITIKTFPDVIMFKNAQSVLRIELYLRPKYICDVFCSKFHHQSSLQLHPLHVYTFVSSI